MHKKIPNTHIFLFDVYDGLNDGDNDSNIHVYGGSWSLFLLTNYYNANSDSEENKELEMMKKYGI